MAGSQWCDIWNRFWPMYFQERISQLLALYVFLGRRDGDGQYQMRGYSTGSSCPNSCRRMCAGVLHYLHADILDYLHADIHVHASTLVDYLFSMFALPSTRDLYANDAQSIRSTGTLTCTVPPPAATGTTTITTGGLCGPANGNLQCGNGFGDCCSIYGFCELIDYRV